MVHDDWEGRLELKDINVGKSSGSGLIPPGVKTCAYNGSVLEAKWINSQGVIYPIREFLLQWRDRNRQRNEQCPTSEHLVLFEIEFEENSPQKFEGYVFTQKRKTMAGYTWWSGIPFGWYARKID